MELRLLHQMTFCWLTEIWLIIMFYLCALMCFIMTQSIMTDLALRHFKAFLLYQCAVIMSIWWKFHVSTINPFRNTTRHDIHFFGNQFRTLQFSRVTFSVKTISKNTFQTHQLGTSNLLLENVLDHSIRPKPCAQHKNFKKHTSS